VKSRERWRNSCSWIARASAWRWSRRSSKAKYAQLSTKTLRARETDQRLTCGDRRTRSRGTCVCGSKRCLCPETRQCPPTSTRDLPHLSSVH
jgi:hypothetical protein